MLQRAFRCTATLHAPPHFRHAVFRQKPRSLSADLIPALPRTVATILRQRGKERRANQGENKSRNSSRSASSSAQQQQQQQVQQQHSFSNPMLRRVSNANFQVFSAEANATSPAAVNRRSFAGRPAHGKSNVADVAVAGGGAREGERGGALPRRNVSHDQWRVRRQDTIRRQRRMRQAARDNASDPSMHPCPLQLGRCPDPATCAFRHVPATTCINILRFGRCRAAEEDGSCPFDHQDLATTKSAAASSPALSAASVFEKKHNETSEKDETVVFIFNHVLSLQQQHENRCDSMAEDARQASIHVLARALTVLESQPRKKHRQDATADDVDVEKDHDHDVGHTVPRPIIASGAESFSAFAASLKQDAETVFATAALPKTAAITTNRSSSSNKNSSDAFAEASARIAAAVSLHPLLFVVQPVDPTLITVDIAVWRVIKKTTTEVGDVASIYRALFLAAADIHPAKRLAAISWAQTRLEELNAGIELLNERQEDGGSRAVVSSRTLERELAAKRVFLRQICKWFERSETQQQQQQQPLSGKQFVLNVSSVMKTLAKEVLLFPQTYSTAATAGGGGGGGRGSSLSLSLNSSSEVSLLLDATQLCGECVAEMFRARDGRRSVHPQLLIHWKACFANFVAVCLRAVFLADKFGTTCQHQLEHQQQQRSLLQLLAHEGQSQSEWALRNAVALNIWRTMRNTKKVGGSNNNNSSNNRIHRDSRLDVVASFLTRLRNASSGSAALVSGDTASSLLLVPLCEQEHAQKSSKRAMKLAFRVLVDGTAPPSGTSNARAAPAPRCTFERNTASVTAALAVMLSAGKQRQHGTYVRSVLILLLRSELLQHEPANDYLDPYFGTLLPSAKHPIKSNGGNSTGTSSAILPSAHVFCLLARCPHDFVDAVAESIHTAFVEERTARGGASSTQRPSLSTRGKVAIGRPVLKWLQLSRRSAVVFGGEPRFQQLGRSGSLQQQQHQQQQQKHQIVAAVLGLGHRVLPRVSVALNLMEACVSPDTSNNSSNDNTAGAAAAVNRKMRNHREELQAVIRIIQSHQQKQQQQQKRSLANLVDDVDDKSAAIVAGVPMVLLRDLCTSDTINNDRGDHSASLASAALLSDFVCLWIERCICDLAAQASAAETKSILQEIVNVVMTMTNTSDGNSGSVELRQKVAETILIHQLLDDERNMRNTVACFLGQCPPTAAVGWPLQDASLLASLRTSVPVAVTLLLAASASVSSQSVSRSIDSQPTSSLKTEVLTAATSFALRQTLREEEREDVFRASCADLLQQEMVQHLCADAQSISQNNWNRLAFLVAMSDHN